VVYLKPKQLIIKDCARRFVLKLYRHETSRGLFAIAELLVLFVTLSNDEVCDNGNTIKQYNFQNNYGVIAYRGMFVVVHLYSGFPIDPQIFPEGQIFTQNYHFGDLWAVRPHL